MTLSCKYYILAGLICLCACTTKSKYNYKISEKLHQPSDIKREIDFVFNNLEEKHPGIYWYISKDSLKFKIDSLKNAIDEPINTKSFYLKLAPIVSSINCGHTRLLLASKKTSGKEKRESISKDINLINNYSYILNNRKLYIRNGKIRDSLLLPGNEIVAINDISVTDIVDSLLQFIPSDGYNTTFKYALLNRNFNLWYGSIFKNGDSLKFTKISNDVRGSVTLKKGNPIKKVGNEIFKNELASKSGKPSNKRNRYKGLDENKQPILDYKLLDTLTKTGYLKVKSFSFNHADFERFYKETFKEIENTGVNNLILDLRNNGGGSLKASRTLFSYLTQDNFYYLQKAETKGRFLVSNGKLFNIITSPFSWLSNQLLIKKTDNRYYAKIKGTNPLKPARNNYKGNLFVITNGLTFSAATLLSANLKGINRATFVGTEGGGGFNQCAAGRIPEIDLPTSGLKLRFGLYRIAPVIQNKSIGRSIFPDILVQVNLQDELKKTDPEVDTILTIIKKRI